MEDVHRHGLRTAWLARRVVGMLGLDDTTAAAVALAARSHDVGKRFIASRILDKPGALAPHERQQVERHAVFGAWALMSAQPVPDETPNLAAQVALLHHEWWNGRGYPFGLAGTAIPIGARVTAVADVFDALVHERCYKRAWTHEDAMRHLLEQRGHQFDPQCAEAMHLVAGRLPDDWAAQAMQAEEVCSVSLQPQDAAQARPLP